MDITLNVATKASATKTNLDTITLDANTTVTGAAGAKYSTIDITPIASDAAFASKALKTGYTVKYYSDNTGNTEIQPTADLPAAGTAECFVKVTADGTDPN